MNNVLIISPHPDDEMLGCGQLMAKLLAEGKHLSVIFLSRGEGIDTTGERELLTEARHQLSINANRLIGNDSDNLYFFDFPDGKFEKVAEQEIDKVLKKIKEIKPAYIFLPHPLEYSPDHEFASNLFLNKIDQTSTKLLFYCVWSWYHLPLYRIHQIDFKRSRSVSCYSNVKSQAAAIYAEARNQYGEYLSGKLPKWLLKAAQLSTEYYIEA